VAAKSKARRRRAKSPSSVKSVRPAADNSSGAKPATFELAEIRRLIRLVQRTGIGELEVTAGGRTVRIAQAGNVAPAGIHVPPPRGPAGGTAAPGEAPTPQAESSEKLVAITSPMVGTFYRAPAPDADPYVEMGDNVEVGQTVCIIEAMKLMNEIESEAKGRIVRILVENAQPVEFGQTLFLLEPL
jgi:acetyl-CoA carboxylase biotin carboxyl carrier protein